jgi:hypothetical protein
MATLYDILQVAPSASKEVIEMAYKADKAESTSIHNTNTGGNAICYRNFSG